MVRDNLGAEATKDPPSREVLVPDALDPPPKRHFLMCAFNSGFGCKEHSNVVFSRQRNWEWGHCTHENVFALRCRLKCV